MKSVQKIMIDVIKQTGYTDVIFAKATRIQISFLSSLTKIMVDDNNKKKISNKMKIKKMHCEFECSYKNYAISKVWPIIKEARERLVVIRIHPDWKLFSSCSILTTYQEQHYHDYFFALSDFTFVAGPFSFLPKKHAEIYFPCSKPLSVIEHGFLFIDSLLSFLQSFSSFSPIVVVIVSSADETIFFNNPSFLLFVSESLFYDESYFEETCYLWRLLTETLTNKCCFSFLDDPFLQDGFTHVVSNHFLASIFGQNEIDYQNYQCTEKNKIIMNMVERFIGIDAMQSFIKTFLQRFSGSGSSSISLFDSLLHELFPSLPIRNHIDLWQEFLEQEDNKNKIMCQYELNSKIHDVSLQWLLPFGDKTYMVKIIIYNNPKQYHSHIEWIHKTKEIKWKYFTGTRLTRKIRYQPSDVAVFWIRIDPHHLLPWYIQPLYAIEQSPAMWIRQLYYDKTVSAQLQAIDALKELNNNNKIQFTKTMQNNIHKMVSNLQFFYAVRIAALALCSTDYLLVLCKDFSVTPLNTEDYLFKKGFILFLSGIQNPSSPQWVLDFFLTYLNHDEDLLVDHPLLESFILGASHLRFPFVQDENEEKNTLLKCLQGFMDYDDLFPSPHHKIKKACLLTIN